MDVGVSPLFIYGDWESIKSYKNLSPSKDGHTLDLDQKSEEGYIIQTRRRLGGRASFNGGLGEEMYTPVTVIDFGLAPVAKSNSYFIGHVDTLEEAEDKFQFLPLTEKQLDRFQIGDQGMIELEGGVSVHLGAQAAIAHIGIKAVIQGGWSCFVQKISDDEVYVELKKIKETGRSIYANLTIPYIESGIMEQAAHGFSYIINYKTEAGLKAYGHFLKGQLTKIDEQEDVIKKVSTIKSNRNTKFTGYGFGIPFVSFANYANSKETTHSTEYVKDIYDKETKTEYALSLKKRDMSFFGLRTVVDTAFLIKKQNKKTEMQMYFKHITNFSKSSKLIDIKNSLIKLTGLKSFLDFSIKENEKLKYAEIVFAVNFGPRIVEALKNNREQVVELLNNVKYRINNKEKTEIKNVDKLIKQLDQNNFKLTDAANFGQGLWNSRVLFNFELELIKKCGGEISYEVSGKRISRLLRFKTFEESENCPLN